MPWLPRFVRSVLLPADVVFLYALIAAAGPASGRLPASVLRGPNLWLAALLAWSVWSAAHAPYWAFALAEFLRLALGVGVYFAAGYALRPAEVRLLPLCLIGFGAAVGLAELGQFGQALDASGIPVNSIFGNREQLGSFLTLLLAPALALSLDRRRPALTAQGAAALLGAALLLARTRSAWAGAAASVLLLAALSGRYSSVRLTRRNRTLVVGPALLVVLGFGGLLAFSELAPLVSTRAATLSHALDDTSFSDRLHRWRSACRMASEQPVTGWGLGTWPVVQGRWTHQGDDTAEVLAAGTGHSNLAHNFWVQWTAETGGVGLALHLGFFAAFFAAALFALPRLDRSRRTLLIACLVGAAAGVVDMLGAPSYTFPGVSSLLWVWLGLGMALIGDTAETPPAWAVWLIPVGVGLCAALAVVGIGDHLRASGADVPRGTLIVTANPPGPVPPGTRVLWTAIYTAPNGTPRPTAPGTIWTTDTGHLEKTSPTYITVPNAPEHSGWQATVPQGIREVTVTAHYWDNFSRSYAASETVTVK